MDYNEKNYTISFNWSFSVSKFNKKFWRRAISRVLKITSSAQRVVWRAQVPRLIPETNYSTEVKNSPQGLLGRYSFNRLLTCTCPQDFLNCRCNMDCKPSIGFYHFTLNLYKFNELISVLCAISFGLCHKCHMT